MNIWLYWDNPPNKTKPPYIDLCLETVFRHCGRKSSIVVINSKNIHEYIKDLREDWHYIKGFNNKANYVRGKLLQQHGGVWLDSDLVVMRDLSLLFEKMYGQNEYDLVTTGSPEYGYGEPENNFIVSKKDGKTIGEYVRLMDDMLDSNPAGFTITWGTFGVQLLRKAVSRTKYLHIPAKLVIPISWQKTVEFSTCKPLSKFESKGMYCFMLYNKMFKTQRSRIVTMSRKELLSTPMLIGQIFRKAMGVT